MANKNLIITEDGSHTYFVPEIGESYHSKHGAIQESRHIFIDSGLKMIDKTEIRIFEMGFGSGLNALLTLEYARLNNKSIHYDAIELYPIDNKEASVFNYPQLLGVSQDDFMMLHNSEWETGNDLTPFFNLHKTKADISTYSHKKLYDLIYFDAFSPNVQPDLWKTPIFIKLYKSLSPGGILSSYSVRGDFRRALKEAGFLVEKIPGPPGKRHITRARKKNTILG